MPPGPPIKEADVPVDTSIYGNLLHPAPTLMDNVNALDQADAQRTQLAGAKLNLIGQQQSLADQQAVRALYQRPDFNPSTPEGMSALRAASPSTWLQTQKALLDNQKTQADIGKTTADAGKATAEAAMNQFDLARKKVEIGTGIVTSAMTPADAHAKFQQAVQQGLMTPDEAAQKEQEVPTDPAGFQRWKESSSLALLTASQRIDAAQKAATQAETVRHNKADEANTVRGQNITASNNAATIAKDYAVAGLGPNGQPSTDRAATVKAIGEYRMSPPTLQALRNPRMAAIMDDVNAQYPGFDATQYASRQKAVKDFGTGPVGLNVQAQNTALNHLATLRDLAQAQKNGDVQLFNKLANSWAAQTGNPAPTNLQAAVNMVAPEITKAVVGTAGGVHDRAESAAVLNPNAAPAQTLGTISTIEDLLGGRLAENARTYKRTTKLDNFTDMLSPAAQAVLAKRTPAQTTQAPASAGAGVPDDIAAILAKHGVK